MSERQLGGDVVLEEFRGIGGAADDDHAQPGETFHPPGDGVRSGDEDGRGKERVAKLRAETCKTIGSNSPTHL